MNDERIIFRDRKNTDSCKWDDMTPNFGEEGLHAMWVADMDFQVPSCVQKALKDYVDHGVFGYYKVPESYFNAFINWQKKYHSFEVKKEWIRFSPGVVPAINWWIQILTEPGDSVAVLTPVYYPFLNAVKANGRRLAPCDLINSSGLYSIDFDGFEKMIAETKAKLLIFSSPHNPVGRVWSLEELRRLMDICRKHGVYVLSDEIHQDITFGGAKQIPTALAGDYDSFLVTLTAATKTFNLASCQNSFVIIPDGTLRKKFDEFTEAIQISDGNSFGYIAVRAAYEEGRPWFEKAKEIIADNEACVRKAFSEALPLVEISPLEGTYLLWMNFSAYLKPEEMKDFMQKTCGLAFDYGHWFGGDRFASFVRMNLAASPGSVKKAVDAITSNLPKR